MNSRCNVASDHHAQGTINYPVHHTDCNISLQGNAYGHPNFEDGKFVVTSKVMDLDISNGRSSTYSGREYILGQTNQEWIVWLRENNFTEYLDGIEKLSATLLN